MKQLVILCSALLICTAAFAQPLKFTPRSMEGFYLDERVPLKKGLNFFVITERKEFIKYFGLINKPDTPDFDYEAAIVVAMPPQDRQSFLSFTPHAFKAGNYVEIYFTAKHDKHKIPYTAHPIVVAAIPKYLSVTTVNFYEDEKKKLYKSIRIRN